MTRIFRTIAEWRELRNSPEFAGSLGFVPTMGALHPGHESLVKRSRDENDRTVVSIFVNPTQFNDPKDLEKYPRTWEEDLRRLKDAGADYVLYPEFKELYADGYRYRVQESELSQVLCGAHRPGHFDGVLTVVLKLLNLARADHAYFGEKDYQQLLLIQGMVDAFFMPTRIVACPTLREQDGLAMSSRNSLLTREERELAPLFAKLLRSDEKVTDIATKLRERGFEVDYLEERFGRRFGAVKLGKVRLIDNVEI